MQRWRTQQEPCLQLKLEQIALRRESAPQVHARFISDQYFQKLCYLLDFLLLRDYAGTVCIGSVPGSHDWTNDWRLPVRELRPSFYRSDQVPCERRCVRLPAVPREDGEADGMKFCYILKKHFLPCFFNLKNKEVRRCTINIDKLLHNFMHIWLYFNKEMRVTPFSLVSYELSQNH